MILAFGVVVWVFSLLVVVWVLVSGWFVLFCGGVGVVGIAMLLCA